MSLSLDRQNAYRARYRKLHPQWQPATEVYEQLIRERLRDGMRVLDLGCGRGGVLEQLGEAVSAPLGSDPDLASLREHRLPTLLRLQAVSERLPLRAESVEMVVCSWVFEHLADPARVFSEVARVLKPGGSFISLTPNAGSLVVTINRVLRPLQSVLVPRLYGRDEADTFPVLYHANRPATLLRLASEAGLQLSILRQIADPSYLAFTPLLFRLSQTLAQATPPVHLVAVMSKPAHPEAITR